jgi:hypothetical protein
MNPTGVPSIDAIIDGFPQQPDKIQGLPTYHTLNMLRQQVYRNANSISSTLGGGGYGYLGALMSTPKYLAATAPNNILFTAPVFPGYLPAAIIGTAAAMTGSALCPQQRPMQVAGAQQRHQGTAQADHQHSQT